MLKVQGVTIQNYILSKKYHLYHTKVNELFYVPNVLNEILIKAI